MQNKELRRAAAINQSWKTPKKGQYSQKEDRHKGRVKGPYYSPIGVISIKGKASWTIDLRKDNIAKKETDIREG